MSAPKKHIKKKEREENKRMSYCFMRTQKIKSDGSMKTAYAHNFRQYDVPNADPDKRDENEELISLPEGMDYSDVYKQKIKEAPGYAGRSPRADAVRGIEVMLTYNARNLSKDFDEEAWKRENVRWLQDTFGKDNVISAVLHKDEATPHIHAMVIPMVNGRLNARHFTGGKGALSELQTSYGKYMERVGLERGLKYSQAEHTDISRYYAALNAVISQELPHPQKDETVYEYRERANAVYIDSNLNHFGKENELKRKIIESKTMEFNDKIDLQKLRRQERIDEKTRKQAKLFEDVLKGLKNGYFPTEEENENFKRTMQEISKWQREREKSIGFGEIK